ncbi:MAG: hypothetical protein HC913_11045 [Microscillaceae bacterium]|nr:hypothetical protein [Microscillaceae bacterium]
MKKVLLPLALVVLIGFSACAKRYTCPTYLHNTEENKDLRVKANPDQDNTKEAIKG